MSARLPCSTPRCTNDRPAVPAGSSRWWDKCYKCAAGISASSARARWINSESDTRRLEREIAELRDRLDALEEVA